MTPALFLLATLTAPSAPAAEPAWTLTVDPLTAALGFAHLQVERRLQDHASLYLGPSLRLYDGILPDINGPYVGLGLEAGARWFPWGKAPRGGWLMVRGVGAHLHTTDGSKQQALGGYTSALAGGTAIIGERFVLSGGAGLSWFSYEVGGYGPAGFIPAAHTNLGVAL